MGSRATLSPLESDDAGADAGALGIARAAFGARGSLGSATSGASLGELAELAVLGTGSRPAALVERARAVPANGERAARSAGPSSARLAT